MMSVLPRRIRANFLKRLCSRFLTCVLRMFDVMSIRQKLEGLDVNELELVLRMLT